MGTPINRVIYFINRQITFMFKTVGDLVQYYRSSVCVPFLSSCVSSGNKSNCRAPTLISFSTLSAVMSNGLGSFSQTIATIWVQENLTLKVQPHTHPQKILNWGSQTNKQRNNLEKWKRTKAQDKGYRGQRGTQATTGCRWQKGGLSGRSGESLWPSPLPQVM